MAIKLLITGDLVLEQAYNATKLLNQDMVDLFASSDINVVNLEAPITTTNEKSLKIGLNIKGDRESTEQVLKVLKIDVVTLANNHILDYGTQGVKDTLEFCRENHIQTVGAGMDIKEASKTLFLDTEEGKIALVNFAENEFTAATGTSAGFNPMDVIDNVNQIKEAKKHADYVFVIIHGGHEYYKLPSPRMQKQYRFYAEQGADLIVGHHTHCINGYEIHKEVPIYYSLGNFLFPKMYTKNKDWNTGLILQVRLSEKIIKTELIPIRFEPKTEEIFLLGSEERMKIKDEISKLNNIIKDSGLLLENWSAYVASKRESFLSLWSPVAFFRNRYTEFLQRKTKFFFINRKGIAYYLNQMRCEAHYDLSKEVLHNYLKE